jgi:FkbH-like protein
MIFDNIKVFVKESIVYRKVHFFEYRAITEKAEFLMTFEEYKAKVQQLKLSDYAGLLNVGRKWKKIESGRLYDVKIGVLGTSSIQLTVSVLRALLCKYDVYADIYEGEYNGILMDVFDDNSSLYRFAPSYVILIPDIRDLSSYIPRVLASENEIRESVEKAVEHYCNICNKIHDKLPGCQVLLSNFVEQVEDPLGNLEGNYLFSQSQFCRMVNLELVRQRKAFTTIIDIEKLAAGIGKNNWFDESAYFLNKSGFSLEYIGFFCDAFARQFAPFMGKPKKCLVLDLDNTLWGGVVGDLGYDGIQLDPNDAVGEAYLHFQEYLKSLKNRGIILAVCSKNDEENAREPFEKNEHMILRMPDIAFFMANWTDKVSNIRMIAQELNIGLDSMVFFDDNPTERALVREFIPEVSVIDVPKDPAYYVRALDQAFCFEWTQLTEEDINRIHSYTENTSRKELLDSCDNYNDFLKKLNMQVKWAPVSDITAERFAQLTNKSNQFNLRTQRYSEAEIDDMRTSDKYKLYTVSLKDTFSNYGVIGCVVLRFEEDNCIIENWVMSCRVLKKTVENYTADKIVETARKMSVKQVIGEYIPSKKNGMVSGLYEDLGFEKSLSEGNSQKYVLANKNLQTYQQKYIMKEIV